MKIDFDEARHEYRVDGRLVPNVTRVLAGMVDLSMVRNLEEVQEKGKAIHAMISMDCKGTLDIAGLPDWLHQPYEEWLNWCVKTRFKALESELIVYHQDFKYIGTLDLVGTINDDQPVLIDIKRSFIAGKVTGLQLAAYRQAYHRQNEDFRTIAGMYALRIHENHKAKMECHNDARFEDFLTALNYYWLTQRMKS
jgi:hypothetical protein